MADNNYEVRIIRHVAEGDIDRNYVEGWLECDGKRITATVVEDIPPQWNRLMLEIAALTARLVVAERLCIAVAKQGAQLNAQ